MPYKIAVTMVPVIQKRTISNFVFGEVFDIIPETLSAKIRIKSDIILNLMKEYFLEKF